MKNIRLTMLAAVLLPAAMLSSCGGGAKQLSDAEILTLIYQQAGGENWSENNKKGWLSENLSDWKGVKVNDEGRVTELTVSEAKGVIPSEISGLTELKKLNLVIKNKKNEDPADCVPASISELTKLEYLRINAYISNSFPSLKDMKDLRTLILASGDAAYPELGSRELTELTLIGFDGEIPDYVYENHNLTRLDIEPGKLVGGVSPKIADLKNLTFLKIDYSKFIGGVDVPDTPFPGEEIFSLKNLETVFLRGLSTSGTLPASVGDLSKLNSLILCKLGLSGELPAELGNLPKIETLEIYNNKISGTIPVELFNATTLKTLWFNNNELTGSIPKEIGKLVNLEGIQLYGNHLSGSIPAELANCTKLGKGVFVDFSKNELSPEIPAAVKAMEKFDKFKF